MEFSKTASQWVGPKGEERQTGGHGDGETSFNILRRVLYEDLASQHPDPTDAIAAADKYLADKKLSPERYPAINVELLQRGWVIIDDNKWEVPHVMGKDLDTVLRAGEPVLRAISQAGTVLLVYEGAGAGVEVSNDDVENAAGDLAEAIELAKSRVSQNSASSIFDFDLGSWASTPRRSVAFFR